MGTFSTKIDAHMSRICRQLESMMNIEFISKHSNLTGEHITRFILIYINLEKNKVQCVPFCQLKGHNIFACKGFTIGSSPLQERGEERKPLASKDEVIKTKKIFPFLSIMLSNNLMLVVNFHLFLKDFLSKDEKPQALTYTLGQ